MEFKHRLEALRRQMELSQQDLANICGVSLNTFRRWEYGEQEPRLSELQKLATALGVSCAALIGEEEAKAADKITLRHGALSLDVPTTPAGLAFLEKKLSEFTMSESPTQSSKAG